MADKLKIYNDAILLCGGELLAGLTDGVKSRRLCDDQYAGAVNETIEAGAWKFAMRSLQSSADADLTPQFGYVNAHSKPADMARPYLVSASPTFDPPLEDYMLEGDTYFANYDPLYLRFVSNDKSYGGDLGKWTFLFTRAVVTLLAERIVVGFTDSEQKLDRITKQRMAARSKALSMDAFREGPKRPPAGRWVRARRGTRSGYGAMPDC